MWTRVDAQVGQTVASVSADMGGSPLTASRAEWPTALDLNTQITITDRYDVQTTYSVVGCEACSGLYHLTLALQPLQLVEIDVQGNPLQQQVTTPPDPPPVALNADPAQPSEVIP
jgi:hypothetical protein